jgi:hypothetical protein
MVLVKYAIHHYKLQQWHTVVDLFPNELRLGFLAGAY